MGKKSSSSSTYTDPRYEEALREESALAERQQNWYLNTVYPWIKDTVNQNVEQNNAARDDALADYDWWKQYTQEQTDRLTQRYQEYYDRWKNSYLPVEQQLMSQANQYLSDEYQANEAAKAAGYVNQQYGIQQQANAMNMAQYGVDTTTAPDYTSYNRNQSLQQMAAAAAASNQARDAANTSGWNKLTQLSALGQSYLGNANASAMTSTNTASTLSNAASAAQNQSVTTQNLTTQNVANYNQIGLSSYQSLQDAWGQYGKQGLQVTNDVRAAENAANQAAAQKSASTMGAVATVASTVAIAF